LTEKLQAQPGKIDILGKEMRSWSILKNFFYEKISKGCKGGLALKRLPGLRKGRPRVIIE